MILDSMLSDEYILSIFIIWTKIVKNQWTLSYMNGHLKHTFVGLISEECEVAYKNIISIYAYMDLNMHTNYLRIFM